LSFDGQGSVLWRRAEEKCTKLWTTAEPGSMLGKNGVETWRMSTDIHCVTFMLHLKLFPSAESGLQSVHAE